MTIAPYVFIAVAFPLVLSLIVSVVLHRGKSTFDHFVLGGRNIPRSHYVATLTASNAALANILFLYVYWGYRYGIWAWLWGSIFWGLGFWIFSKVAKLPRFGILSSSERPESGLNEIMGSEYRSRLITVACAIASGLAFLFLLTLELNVGAKIFSGLAPNATSMTPYMFALVIGTVLAAYAAYGGMKAVFQTDAIQLILIIAAAISLLALVHRLSPDLTVPGLIAKSAKTTPVFSLSWSYIPFILGSAFSWGFWFLCTMDMWQRTIATKVERPVIGMKAILPSFILLLFVTLSGVLVGVYLKETINSPYPPKYPLVDFLHSAFTAVNGNTVSLILLCIVISGFTAAMLSTVDTYIILVSQSLTTDLPSLRHGLPHERIQSDEAADTKLRRRVQNFTAVIPFLSVGVFFVLNQLAEQDTFTLYMIAGSLPLSILPVVLGALGIKDIEKRKRLSRSAAIAIIVSILVSITTNLILATYALKSYSQIAFGLLYFTPLLAAGIAAVPFVSLLRRHP